MESWLARLRRARWAIDSGLSLDLAKPRGLLAQEIAGAQNPYILGTAFRTGLAEADDLQQLRDYDSKRRLLFAQRPRGLPEPPIFFLNQQDWVIRAAVMRGDLSDEERDRLEQKLLVQMDKLSTDPHIVLETPLRVTQLLEAIGRPIDRNS